MRFFHLSDLHIGKQLHHYNLKEDQEHILAEIISYAESIKPDAILIAGDIYDKPVPSAEAVSLFDDFLTRLGRLEPHIPVMIIAGNHDSSKRLDYAGRLLENQQIYIAGNCPESEEEHLKKITLKDEYGKVNFYLLPFMKPGYLRWMCGGDAPESYTEAVNLILRREEIDFQERNVLLAHQFFTASGFSPAVCDSERISVGGIDNVDISAVKEFDYVALGHLHGAQKVKEDHIRYCGTLMKYSVSESNHEKSLHLIELDKKGEQARITGLPVHPLRNVRKIRGTLEEILTGKDAEEKDDYVSVTLTDEIDPYKPKEQLEKVYSHILEIRMDNTRTRKKLDFSREDVKIENPMAAFDEFYREMQGRSLSETEYRLMEQIIDQAGGEIR